MRRVRQLCLTFGVACVLGALGAATGEASTVTIGSTETAAIPSAFGSPGTITLANLTLGAPGMTVASPVNGVVIRWRIAEASGGPFYLRVIRSSSAGQFLGVGTSAPATPLGSGVQTFSTNLPIQRGDLIGLDTSHASDEAGALLRPGSTVAGWTPALPNGVPTFPTATAPGGELVLSAEIQPVPTVTVVSPSSGSIAGGTNVTIAGADLSGATTVRFGEQSAAVFPGSTDAQITAIAPQVTKPGPVAVTVETIAGSSAAVPGGTFTYLGCVVPKLKGKTVRAARKKLKKAGCKLGKIKGEGKKIAGQGAKPRAVLPPGKKVNVKLG